MIIGWLNIVFLKIKTELCSKSVFSTFFIHVVHLCDDMLYLKFNDRPLPKTKFIALENRHFFIEEDKAKAIYPELQEATVKVNMDQPNPVASNCGPICLLNAHTIYKFRDRMHYFNTAGTWLDRFGLVFDIKKDEMNGKNDQQKQRWACWIYRRILFLYLNEPDIFGETSKEISPFSFLQ